MKPYVFVLMFSLLMGSQLASAAPQDDAIPERPRTEELLPETTVAVIQIPSFRDALEKSKNSQAGQFWQDEEIAPLVDGLWQEAELAYDDVKSDVGLDLSDFTSLPAGEMTFAVIAPRRKNPEFMLMLDLNEDDGVLDRVLDRGRELLQQNERELEELTSEDGFDIEAFNLEGGRRVHFFRHNGLLVGCTSEDELNHLIDRWMGREVKKTRPLSANRKYVTIMNQCKGTDDLQAELKFFVDPIALAKSSFRGNAGAQFAINLLPLLGLDNLSGVGGAYYLDEEGYDLIAHTHVLITNPRTGIFALLAFKPTDYEPDSFIPHDIFNHGMISIDAQEAYAELTKIVDSFNEEGFFERVVQENINEQIDINLKDDLIDAMDGRVTFAQWIERPVMAQSSVTAMAFKLKDPEQFESLMQKLLVRAEEDFEPQTDEDGNAVGNTEAPFEGRDYMGITIYGEPQSRQDRRNDRIRNRRNRVDDETGEARVTMEVKFETPCVAIIDDSFIVSFNSRKFMEKMIETHQGESPTLADDEDYARMVDESRKLLKNELPIGNFYSNPEGFGEWMVDLVKSENMQQVIGQQAQSNKYLAGIKQRLDENPLPDFDRLRKYFSKSGGFVTDDDTGLHLLQFTLKNDPADE
jgi:hypothetical protein